MFRFQLKSNSAEVNRKMAIMVSRQIPFATAKSLTLTAKSLVDANKKDMTRIFDNPVAWTRNSFFYIPARKDNPITVIKRKDRSGSNAPASRQNYLEVQQDGGGRKPKAFETALVNRAKGAAGFRYATPTRDTRTTSSGNISLAGVSKILAEAGGRGGKMFVPQRNHPLAIKGGDGVFERMARNKVRKRLHLHNSMPTYRPQFKFYVRMNRYGRKLFPRIFKRELAMAMRTARLR